MAGRAVGLALGITCELIEVDRDRLEERYAAFTRVIG